MDKKLEQIAKTGKRIVAAGIASLLIGCSSVSGYFKPQIGAVFPVVEKEQNYSGSVTLGLACGLGVKGTGLGIEVGADYFKSSGEYIETHSVWPRVNLTATAFKPEAKVNPYLVVGANYLGEVSTVDIPEFDVHENFRNATLGVEFGVGATILDGIDLRLLFNALPSSENVKCVLGFNGGFRVDLSK